MSLIPGVTLSPGGDTTKFPTQPGVLLDFYGNPILPAAGTFDVREFINVTGSTDTTVAGQAAINAASAAGGGFVLFPPSLTPYTCRTAPVIGPGGSHFCLSLPSNVVIVLPRGATITIANGLNAGIVLCTGSTLLGVIGGGTLDGNKANQVDQGIDGGQALIYGTAITYWVFEAIVQNSIRQGWYLSNSSWGRADLTAIANATAGNALAGIEDDANNFTDFYIRAINNLGPGFHWVGGNALSDIKSTVRGFAYGNQFGVLAQYKQGGRLESLVCQSNTNDGIILENCDSCAVVAPYCDTNGRHGVYDLGGTKNSIIAPTCRNNTQYGVITNTSTNTVIEAPQLTGNGFGDISVSDAGSTGVNITGGRITGGITDLGVGTIVHNVAGYNPVGVVTPAVPASLGSVPAVNYDRYFVVTNGNAALTIGIQNGPTYTVPAAAVFAFMLPATKVVTYTYGGTAPTHLVEGL